MSVIAAAATEGAIPAAAIAASGNAVPSYLNEIGVASGKPATIELRLWIGTDGTVQRVAFPPFAHAQANADLEAAIIGRRLAAPPAGILFPLRIAVEVKPE